MADRKEDYRSLCRAEPSIPLFCRDWWLDAACGAENWDVALSGKDTIQGAMPWFLKKRGPFRISTVPKLTQHLGPWIRPAKGKFATVLTHSFDTMDDLIGQLPKVDYFTQTFSKDIHTWMPFYWRGYRETTNFTYVLDTRGDMDALWNDFKSNVRGGIRKAEKLVTIRPGGVEEFIVLNEKIFQRQNMAVPYAADYLRRLDAACERMGRREILVAEDSQGLAHAGAYCVFDDTTTYYLIAGSDPDHRASQALTLVLWQAMKNAHERGQIFDFEGSMIKSIEQFIRWFNATPTPYFQISRASPLLEAGLALASATGLRGRR